MAFYDERIKGKSADELLETAGGRGMNSVWTGPEGELLRVAAQIRVTQDQIEAQFNATKHLVDCANGVTASQEKATRALVETIGGLIKSINRASDDSGRLARRIAFLTLFLVLVGAGQVIAIAWPYLAWWWRH